MRKAPRSSWSPVAPVCQCGDSDEAAPVLSVPQRPHPVQFAGIGASPWFRSLVSEHVLQVKMSWPPVYSLTPQCAAISHCRVRISFVHGFQIARRRGARMLGRRLVRLCGQTRRWLRTVLALLCLSCGCTEELRIGPLALQFFLAICLPFDKGFQLLF